MSEDDFLEQVGYYAQSQGWMVHHQRPARTATSWRTSVMFDGKGFPDLVLVRERTVFAELKTEVGTLSPDQRKWRARIEGSEGVDYFVWRPSDWPTIESVLRRRRQT